MHEDDSHDGRLTTDPNTEGAAPSGARPSQPEGKPRKLRVRSKGDGGRVLATAIDVIRATFEAERAEMALGARFIAGVDEAGRGPLAGPVVAAACILDPDRIPEGIADSKALDADTREILYQRITSTALAWSVAEADVPRIDRYNILNATMWAMSRAVAALAQKPCVVLVDGNRLPKLPCPGRAIVQGDARSLSIAAASILAKVSRDRRMVALAAQHPGYGFERHKGYGTPEHLSAIDTHGVTVHHRRSFRPVQLALGDPRDTDV
jgi:ribonuclease HII